MILTQASALVNRLQKLENRIMQVLLKDPEFRSAIHEEHHFHTTTFNHSINVARLAVRIACKFKIKVNFSDLIMGALLHDYFHHNGHKLPRFEWIHAVQGAKNARKRFHINDRVYHIIATHMFPMNISKWPKTKEAWLVNFSDKVCAVKEFFNILRPFKSKRMCL